MVNLQFHLGKSTGDLDCPESNTFGEGNGGSTEQGFGCLWTMPMADDVEQRQHATKHRPNDAQQSNVPSLSLIPFFPDLGMEDPAAEQIFVTIDPQIYQTPSLSAPPEKSTSPPLSNIKREIDKAIDLLKRKNPQDAEGTIYGLLRTDSLILDSVRAIEFSVEPSEVVVPQIDDHMWIEPSILSISRNHQAASQSDCGTQLKGENPNVSEGDTSGNGKPQEG